MTLYEFLKLDVGARGDYLWQNGEFIANGNDGAAPCAFYALHDFYAEVVFDLEFSCIVSVVPFKEGDRYARMVEAMPPVNNCS